MGALQGLGEAAPGRQKEAPWQWRRGWSSPPCKDYARGRCWLDRCRFLHSDTGESAKNQEPEKDNEKADEKEAEKEKEPEQEKAEENETEKEKGQEQCEEARHHKMGDELQETVWELSLRAELDAWLGDTTWLASTTARSKRPCWVNRDTGEVVLAQPTPADEKARQTKAAAVRRAANVHASNPRVGLALAQKLGMSLAELSEESLKLEEAERRRCERANGYWAKLLAARRKQ